MRLSDRARSILRQRFLPLPFHSSSEMSARLTSSISVLRSVTLEAENAIFWSKLTLRTDHSVGAGQNIERSFDISAVFGSERTTELYAFGDLGAY